jgi:dihydrofolate reductase
MRKIVLYLHISLDGVVSNSDQWMSFSDDILTDAIDYYKTLDTVVFGSNTYPFLSNYWQTAEESSNSPLEKEFAKKINDINKIVLSGSPKELTWRNSQHLRFTGTQDLIRKLQNLKNQPGKNISVEGGITIWKLLLQNNLFDELLFYVHPTIFGKGIKLFDEINSQATLKLKYSKLLDKGVVSLHYETSNRYDI